MAFLDDKTELADSQTVGTTGASEATTNLIDGGQTTFPGRAPGGRPRVLHFSVAVAFTGGTSVALSLQDGANATTFTSLVSSKAFAISVLTKGKKFSIMIPEDTRRYVRGYFTVTGSMTAGQINAWIDQEP